MHKFTQALLRKPSRNLVKGVRDNIQLIPEYNKALIQHELYYKALEAAGLSIHFLPEREAYPDGVFVEDIAIVNPSFAIITNPGNPERNKEISELEFDLQKWFDKIYQIPSGFIEGGDVLQVDDQFFIGLSERTNKEGIKQFSSLVEKHHFITHSTSVPRWLHLKTGITFLHPDTMIASTVYRHEQIFESFNKIWLEEDQIMSANCLAINDCIIIPESASFIAPRLAHLNKKLVFVDISEFEKLDGGLSCLSLRW